MPKPTPTRENLFKAAQIAAQHAAPKLKALGAEQQRSPEAKRYVDRILHLLKRAASSPPSTPSKRWGSL